MLEIMYGIVFCNCLKIGFKDCAELVSWVNN